jgi:hypothetical protein
MTDELTLAILAEICAPGSDYLFSRREAARHALSMIANLQAQVELLTATQAACDNGSCEEDGCQRSDLTGYRETAAKWVAEYLSSKQDATRYRWSTATEDNASTLHSVLLCHAGDQAKIDERVDEYMKGERQ